MERMEFVEFVTENTKQLSRMHCHEINGGGFLDFRHVNGRVFIWRVYADEGFEVYIPASESVSIEETAKALMKYLRSPS